VTRAARAHRLEVALALVACAALASCSERPRIPLSDAKGDWVVMGFPRRAIAVDGPDGKTVTIDRAIPILVNEIRSGTAAVDIGGGATAPVDVAQLYFLPGSEGDRQLDAWRKSLPWQGWTGGTWAAAAAGDGLYRVELRLQADGREAVHVYFTTRDRVENFEAQGS
jgi:hypothetical protein